MAMAAILNLFTPPPKKAATYYGGYSYNVDHNMAPNGYQFPTSKSTWKPNFAQNGGFLYFGSHFGFKMAAIANQRWISIRHIIIYLETKFLPNRRIFFILAAILDSKWPPEQTNDGYQFATS